MRSRLQLLLTLLFVCFIQAHYIKIDQNEFRASGYYPRPPLPPPIEHLPPPPQHLYATKELTPAELMVDLTNDLAFRILHYHSILNRNNFAYSPSALMSVLVAVYEGSAGRSAAELRNVLQFPSTNVIRIGYRDIHRRLRTYFFGSDNPLKGLSLNKDNVTITRDFEAILMFYGYDLGMDMISSTAAPTSSPSSPSIPMTTNSTTATTAMPSTAGKAEPTETSATSTTIQKPTTSAVATEPITTLTTPTETSTATTSDTTKPMTTISGELTTTPITSLAPTTTTDTITQTQQPTTIIITDTTDLPTTTTITTTPTTTPTTPTTSTTPTTPTTPTIPTATPTTTLTTLTMPTAGTESTDLITTTIPTITTATESEPTTMETTTAASVNTEDDTTEATTINGGANPGGGSEVSALVASFVAEDLSADSPLLRLQAARVTRLPLPPSKLQAPPLPTTPRATYLPSVRRGKQKLSEQNGRRRHKRHLLGHNKDLDASLFVALFDHQQSAHHPHPHRGPELSNGYTVELQPHGFSGSGVGSTGLRGDIEVKANLNTDVISHVFYLSHQQLIHTTFKVYNAVLYYKYFDHLKMSVLELELDTPEYNLMILLPDYHVDLVAAAASLRLGPTLRMMRKQLSPKWVQAIIPDFKLHGTMFLTNDLQNMGILDIFEPNRADFHPMTNENRIYVKHIEQSINVNIRTRPINSQLKQVYGSQTQPIQISVSHPFLFFVIDRELDIAVMSGRILNPQNVRIQ